jgi:hypothetical protein
VWEAILNSELGEYANTFSEVEPQPSVEAMEKHFRKRLEIVNKLLESKKLDAGMAKLARSHFEAHLEELRALRTQQ